MAPAAAPLHPDDERALKRIKRREDTLLAERVQAVKTAAERGASSYAIGAAVGLSHRHVQRIVNGEYDHLLTPDDEA